MPRLDLTELRQDAGRLAETDFPAAVTPSSLPSLKDRKEDEEVLASIHDTTTLAKDKRFEPGSMWRQPFKGIVIVYWITTCLLLAPYWYLMALAGNKPRQAWSAGTAMKVAFIRRITTLCATTGFHTGGNLRHSAKKLKDCEHVRIAPVAEHRINGFVKEAMLLNEVTALPACAFWYPAAPKAGEHGDIVLALHGGAYIMGSAEPTDFVAQIFRGLISESGYTHVLAVDYRLAIKNPFPAQILDALAAYAYMIEDMSISPARITICGDSAGANLAMALCRYLRDHRDLPLPGGTLLCSPWTDPTFSYRKVNGSFTRNYSSDIVNVRVTPVAVKFFLGILPDTTLHSPYISPITSPETRVFKGVENLFRGFPRTLILISESERLWDEAIELRQRMTACDVDVSWHSEPDAVHDWLQFPGLDDTGMIESSYRAIGQWRGRGSEGIV